MRRLRAPPIACEMGEMEGGARGWLAMAFTKTRAVDTPTAVSDMDEVVPVCARLAT